MGKPRRQKRHDGPEKANHGPAEILGRTTRLLLRGAHTEALQILRAGVTRYSGDAAILTRYADALFHGGSVEEAKEDYRRALAIDCEVFQAWYGCGMAEFSLGGYVGAIECLRKAAEIEPRDADVRFYLGKALFQTGDVDAAIDELLIAAKSKDAAIRRQALRQIATIVPGSPSRGNGEILQARRRWARLEEVKEKPRRMPTAKHDSATPKLRVGYVSSFFKSRNWMKPVWGAINHHDRSRFEIHLFADRGRPRADDGYEENPQDSVHDITELSNKEAAARISAAGIDVLVDLNGYSAPGRLGLYMRKPAPNVVGWFNMYASSGIRAFDYIVGDANVIPPDEEGFYGERVLRVSGTYLAFSVLYPVPPVAAPPCLRSGRITFGCLAPQYKITEQVIGAWARILAAAPVACLLLKSSFLGERKNREEVKHRFAERGIAPERVLLEGPAEHYEFLEAYSRMDIALDTFPYNGGTTTAEALWQGAPVLAFNGDRWAGRISRSLLVAAGLGEWAEESLEAYIERAIELANSPGTPDLLAGMRANMRERLSGSAACDSAALCRELEAHYRQGAGLRNRSRPPKSDAMRD